VLCFGNGLSPVRSIIALCFGFRTSDSVSSIMFSRGKQMVEAAKKKNVAPLQQCGMFCSVIFFVAFPSNAVRHTW